MVYYRLFLLLVPVFCMFAQTDAQQNFKYPFHFISQQDGLLHNEVISITQDGKGFMWIATRSGLQRYDGSSFIYYPEMLSSALEGRNSGAAMYADKINQRLWITNDITLEKMDLARSTFVILDPEKIAQDSDIIFNQFRDENNKLWFLSDNAVMCSDSIIKRKWVYKLNVLPHNAHQSTFIATDTASNQTWVTSETGLLVFDKSGGKVFTHQNNPLHHPLLDLQTPDSKNINARLVMIDSRQNIWVSTWGDLLFRYDHVSQKISTYSLTAIKTKQEGGVAGAPTPLVNCLLEDDNHTTWVGTENTGLLRYNPSTDNFDYSIAQDKNKDGIRYDYKIFTLFQDREQNIWIGTDKGISIFNPYRQNFTAIRHQENNRLSISKSEIISFIQLHDGSMFIGTWGGGMAIYDSNFNFKKNVSFTGAPDKNKLWDFQQVDDETVWIGCQHGYIIQYNIKTGNSTTLQPPEMELSTIRCMQKDAQGNLLFGLDNGKIVWWDKQANRFIAWRGEQFLKKEPVVNILIDRQQHYWIGTESGFKEFDPGQMRYVNEWLPGKDPGAGISAKTCQGIEEYNDSTLLIATVYGGLNFFNKRTHRFSHLGIVDGLPSNTIYAIKKDSAGYLWFTTDYGLYKFQPADKRIIPYSMETGLISSSFVANKFFPLQNGQWLTFTLTETISFFPYKKAALQQQPPLKVEITGFRLFDNPLFIDSLLDAKLPVRLSYEQNFFTVEFAALNFLGIHQTNYYHRLTGVDKEWVNGGDKHFANYTGLQPGKYTFEVKAENGEDGGQVVTAFSIIIAPPFWQTWWFISLVNITLILLVVFFVKARERSIREIAAEKLKVQRLSAEKYKSQLELEQITNYFASSLIDKNKVDDILWDVAKNLIGRLGFVDCMIYLWNDEKTKMTQHAGFGPKGSLEDIHERPFDVLPGQGVVGYVIQTREPLLIPDTSIDPRYRADEMVRLSEITVPVIYNGELLGIIDSEHQEKNFYTQQHLQVLTTIATLMATRIRSIEADELLQQKNMEMFSMNEQLSKARLEALRAQMNPHFIFNCLTSIDNLIQIGEKEKATLYLSKFARLIRSILENSVNDTVPCWKDMETLQLYLELEALRFDNKFHYEVVVADDILNGDYKVPPLVIQPFVENAIHHGLLNKITGDKILRIHVSVSDSYVHYLIEDNGVGRAQANIYKELNKPAHRSMGMQLTTDRINLFNQHKNGHVYITDLVDERNQPCGTRVTIKLLNQS